MDKLMKRMESIGIDVQGTDKNGAPVHYQIDGVGATYGIGKEYKDADAAAEHEKERLRSIGALQDLRARGGIPDNLRRIEPRGTAGSERPSETVQSGGRSAQGLTLEQRQTGLPGFHSKLERTIDEKMSESASVEQVRGLTKDISADEKKWLGLDEFLKDKTGKISKPELQEFLRANQLKLEEVTYGGDKDATFEARVQQEIEKAEYQGEDVDPDEIRAELAEEWEAHGPDADGVTKFKDYTLPGGENYREVLLTMPPKETDAVRPHFGSSHFPDDANILAHVRLDDRTDADGKKVLFVEEIQSDWHQMGRRIGYEQNVDREALENRFRELSELKDDLAKDRDPVTNMMRDEKAFHRAADELIEVNRKLTQKTVPDAPFKKTGHEFAFKRILQEAADKGYDRVAWTTGEQQADRYDLSKKIEALHYQKNTDGTYQVSYQANGRSNMMGDRIHAEKLEDYVGKDVAKKIVEGDGAKKQLLADARLAPVWIAELFKDIAASSKERP